MLGQTLQSHYCTCLQSAGANTLYFSLVSVIFYIRLYVSMVRSQLFYCTQIWRPHLMKDILNIERVQCHATKYILNDCTSCYKTRLIKLKLLPLTYLFELQDILFAIKSIKTPTIQFNITNYISFNSASTRSGANNKLIPLHYLNNTSRHSYFHRLPSLWNAMPVFFGMPCLFLF